MKKTTRPASSPLRLERQTLRHLSGGDAHHLDIDTDELLTLPLPRVSRPSVSGLTLSGPLSIECPPLPPTNAGRNG